MKCKFFCEAGEGLFRLPLGGCNTILNQLATLTINIDHLRGGKILEMCEAFALVI